MKLEDLPPTIRVKTEDAMKEEALIPNESHPAISQSGSTRRLVVHSIMLENFKSYEGRQEIGPFDDVHTSNTEIRGSDRPERFR